MPRTSTLLTDTRLRNAKPADKPYKLSDSGGLCLLVLPSGSKHWRFRYRIAGKENVFAIGEYPRVTLAQARTARDQSRELVRKGAHPSHARKTERLEVATNAGNTFKAIAQEWISGNSPRWTDYYRGQVSRFLENDVFPEIGNMPIRHVKAAHILAILKRVSTRRTRRGAQGAPAVALLLRQWCSAIFRYAVATLRADADPAAALRGSVIRNKVRHKNALDARSIAKFVHDLESAPCSKPVQIALSLLLLTFVRPCELRGAYWEEFDLEKRLWVVPAERVKMREKHLVPLSQQSIAVLKGLYALDGRRPQLFPNRRSSDRTMSPTTLNRCLERMGYGGYFSAHAFRTTASTHLNELGWNGELVELQLAHQERNKSRKAYNHALHLPERIKMMQAWADYVDGLGQSDNVLTGSFDSRAMAA